MAQYEPINCRSLVWFTKYEFVHCSLVRCVYVCLLTAYCCWLLRPVQAPDSCAHEVYYHVCTPDIPGSSGILQNPLYTFRNPGFSTLHKWNSSCRSQSEKVDAQNHAKPWLWTIIRFRQVKLLFSVESIRLNCCFDVSAVGLAFHTFGILSGCSQSLWDRALLFSVFE